MVSEYFDYEVMAEIFPKMVKYSALLGGVHSVAQDEFNFMGAATWGTIYVLTDMLGEIGRERANSKRLEKLENKLKNRK